MTSLGCRYGTRRYNTYRIERPPLPAACNPVHAVERLERRRADDLPTVAIEKLGHFALTHRREFAASPLLLFYQPACLGRGVEEQHPPGFRSGALPGVRHAARHEGNSAGATDCDLLADKESDLAAEDVGDFIRC